jgi:hypothetical protein
MIRIRDEFFPDSGSRIPDPRGMFLVRFSCSLIFLLIKLAPETIKSKKKVGFIFHPYFYEQYDPGSGAFLPPGSGIRIRDGAMVESGSGIRDKPSRIRNTGM